MIEATAEQFQEDNKIEVQKIEVQSQKSNQNQESEDKPLKRKKGLKKEIKSKELDVEEEEFNIYSRGTVINAKKHRSATRPKRELDQLNEEEENEHLCPCCGLVETVKGKVEYFKTCDNPDDFSTCGQGVVLYYDYIKFVIIVTFIASVGISIFNIYFSNKYYKELTKVCNNYYHEKLTPSNRLYPKECEFYMTDSDPEIDTDIRQIDTFFFQFSSTNIKDYRELYKKMNPQNADSFESTIINLSLVNFIILIILFIFNLLYIYFLFNKANAADYLVFTVSDYAIFLTNLFNLYDIFKNTLEEVKQYEKKNMDKGRILDDHYYFMHLGFKPTDDMTEIKKFEQFLLGKIFLERRRGKVIKDYGVNRIDFCYKSKEFIEYQQKLNELNEKINKIDLDPNIKKENSKRHLEGTQRNYYSYILPLPPFNCCPKIEPLSDIMEQIKEIEDKMTKLIKDSKEHASEFFGGGAFITFNKIKQQEDYMSKLPGNFFDYVIHFFKNMAFIFCSYCMNKNSTNYYKRNIIFESAPEPEDILFENIETRQIQRFFRTVIVYFISIILCGISFAAIYGLNLLQMYVDEHQSNHTTHIVLLYVISFAITGVTSGMDVLLEIVLEILTKWEKQTTWTNYYLSYSLKLTLFSFVNSAILPTFCEFFINHSDGYEILISNMLMKFLVNAIVTPAMWTLSVGYFLKKIRIYFIEKTKPEEIDKNQKELNELYEYPPMNVSAKYSYIAKTILMSFFYIPIFPLGLVISLLGFILGYWLEKYNFANMYKMPEMLNRQIAEFYTNYFVLTFFVYGIGDWVFLHDCYKNKTWSLVNIILFGVLIIFPYHQMLTFDYLKFEESSLHEDDYNDKYTSFSNDYERANPMTEKEGKLRFLKAKKEKGEIKDDEFNEQKNEIENEQSDQPFGYKGGFQGPHRFRNWKGWGPHFGFGRHRGHRRHPHGPMGEGQGHGPHFGMHGPHFSMQGPYNDTGAYPPYPPQGGYPNYTPGLNNIINEGGYPNSNTNFK